MARYLGAVSGGAFATLMGVVVTLLVAILTATWRIGSKVGGHAQQLKDHGGRIDRLEDNADDHDRWHLHRGDR